MSEWEFTDTLEDKIYEERKKNSEEMRAVVHKYVEKLKPFESWHMEVVFPKICQEFMQEYEPLLEKADRIYSVVKYINQFKREVDCV